MPVRTSVRAAVSLMLAAGSAGLAIIYHNHGAYGLNVLLWRGGSFWLDLPPESPRLSPAIRLALAPGPPAAAAGDLAWHRAAPGFETATLPVLADGKEVDRIVLARIDPAHYRFAVRTAPAGDMGLDAWMASPGATLVINGSYYAPDGRPDTPLISDGSFQGPATYTAQHGAFVADGGGARVVNLSHQTWQAAFAGAHDAMVSWPLLVGEQPGNPPIPVNHRLANRSFVGQDRAGNIILGTTEDAFFSLDRFAVFLHAAPLDLSVALNLDGGPVAALGIEAGDTHLRVQGQWETQERDGRVELLTWPVGTFALPIVLAVLPK